MKILSITLALCFAASSLIAGTMVRTVDIKDLSSHPDRYQGATFSVAGYQSLRRVGATESRITFIESPKTVTAIVSDEDAKKIEAAPAAPIKCQIAKISPMEVTLKVLPPK